MTNRSSFDDARLALSLAHENHTSLCAPFLSALPVTGVAVSMLGRSTGQATVCASNRSVARLDELQFDLGEGPCWDALSSRHPIVEADIRARTTSSWPVFSEALIHDEASRDVAAMYAFPLTVGSLDIGAVDLYSTQSGLLTPEQMADASALARLASWQVLRRILGGQANLNSDDTDANRHSRREVHQATGMVLAQLNIDVTDAALLIRAHAFATERPVAAVAQDIVDRRLDFSAAGAFPPGEGYSPGDVQ